MKPRTKKQKMVVNLSNQLPDLTSSQLLWLRNQFKKKVIYRKKDKTLFCMECGHRWKLDNPELLLSLDNGCVCPQCSEHLELEHSKKVVFNEKSRFVFLTTKRGIQVFRAFEVNVHKRRNEKAKYLITEVIQKWLFEDNSYEVIALKRISGCYSDIFLLSSDLNLKSWKENNAYNLPYFVYPRLRITKVLKRNGLSFECLKHVIDSFRLSVRLQRDPHVETLLKAKQYSLLEDTLRYPARVEMYWSSIKICLRNNYIVEDASIWFDHLESLSEAGKDLRNRKYVCPSNLIEEHNRIVEKERLETIKLLEEQKLSFLKKNNPIYKNKMGALLDIYLEDGSLSIKPLHSIEEFKEESDVMHNCLFSMKYYEKKEVIILSVKNKKKRVATVELDLKNMEILQCRGKCNGVSPYQDKITNLIKNNLHLFKKKKIKIIQSA